MGIKNAEFYADFRSVGKIAENAFEKSYKQNSQLKVNFSAITDSGFISLFNFFFVNIFSLFSNGFILGI